MGKIVAYLTVEPIKFNQTELALHMHLHSKNCEGTERNCNISILLALFVY